MALKIGPRLTALLENKQLVVVATTAKDGTPRMVPVWYDYRDGLIRLNGGQNGGKNRVWLTRLDETKQATLLFLDPQNFFRWATIRGRVVDVSEDPGGNHINELSHRYGGQDYKGPREGRTTVRIEIENVAGAENQVPWDVENS